MAQDKTGKQPGAGGGQQGRGSAASSEQGTRKRPGQSKEPSQIDTTGEEAVRQPS